MNKRKIYLKNYKNPKIFSINRHNSVKRIKRKKLLKSILKIIIFLGIFLIIINFIFNSDYFQIKNIKIKGDLTFSVKIEEITKKSLNQPRFLIFKNNNLFLLNSKIIKDEIMKEIKEIKFLNIKRIFPNSIEINVKEKIAKIGWETNDKKYLIDEDGYLLKETDNFDNLPIVKDTSNMPINYDKKIVYPDFIKFIEDLLVKLKSSNIQPDNFLEIKETTFVVYVNTKEGYKIVFDTTKSLSQQMKKLEETLKQIGEQKNKLEYIDLTVKNKSICKFK